MSFALWMILVAILLPTLTGWRKRADWAQRNHFEALAPFAAAVLVATITHANPATVNALAGAWVLCRVGYTACYIGDRPTLRSLAWSVGFFCVIGLFVVSA